MGLSIFPMIKRGWCIGWFMRRCRAGTVRQLLRGSIRFMVGHAHPTPSTSFGTVLNGVKNLSWE
jgi:hypothetical protein